MSDHELTAFEQEACAHWPNHTVAKAVILHRLALAGFRVLDARKEQGRQ